MPSITRPKKYDRFVRKKYILLYFLYSLGLWFLYFLYRNEDIGIYRLAGMAVLLAIATTIAVTLIFLYKIRLYKRQRSNKNKLKPENPVSEKNAAEAINGNR